MLCFRSLLTNIICYAQLRTIHYLSSGTDKQISAGIVTVVVLTDANQIQGRNKKNGKGYVCTGNEKVLKYLGLIFLK